MYLDEALREVTLCTSLLAAGEAGDASENGLRRFYIRVPNIRRIVKQGYSFYGLSAGDILKTWDHIWKKSEYYEVAHQALYYYQHKHLSRAEFTKIKTWINRCDCWEHSDDLSKIYAQVVEDNPGWILPQYKIWNRSKSPWQRRQSIVGLIEYASKRTKVLSFKTLIKHVKPLLNDEDYYVQKGIGWTLREIYNIYPVDAAAFIEAHITKLSANAFSSATEKLDKATKLRLKSMRKKQ